jgi:SsrA-binding protein
MVSVMVKKSLNKQATQAQTPSASNRKAGFTIAIEETIEAGIVLTGEEIKSVRAGRMQLTGAYLKLMYASNHRNQIPEPVLIGVHLSQSSDPQRTRKLLLHTKEIIHIQECIARKGYAAVPTRLYLKRGWAKVAIGIGRGRKNHDKRQLLKSRDLDREARREAR